MHCLRDWSNRFSNNKACRGRFSIVDGHGFESILRGAMEVECKPSSKHLVVKIKNKDDRRTLTTFRLDISCGLKVWIIESLLVLGRLLARANQSAPSEGNGRQASSVDRPLRLTTAPRERTGCSPASLPPEGTSWPFSWCIGSDGSPVGGVQQPPPTMVLEENVRVSGVSPPAQRGGKAVWLPVHLTPHSSPGAQ